MIPRGAAAPALLAAALGAASLAADGAAARARSPEARAARGTPPLGAATVVAVDLLWRRGTALLEEGRRPEGLAALEAAGAAAPRLPAAHEARGLIVAFDMAGGAASAEDRDRWVREGVRILEEGARRNPSDPGIRATLARVLFDRSLRWPEVRALLRRERGRDPVDEAVDLLASCVAADPGEGRFTIWLSDALLERGRAALEGAPADAPVPAAAADFRRAAAALRALAPLAPADSRATLETLAAGAEAVAEAALSPDPARRRVLLDSLGQGGPPGK